MKQLNLLIIGLVFLCSCDASEDLIVDLNNSPELNLVYGSKSGSFVKDSVKTSGEVGQFTFDFTLEVNDFNGNVSAVDIVNGIGSPYLLVQYDSILVDLQIVNVNPKANTIDLTGLFFESGEHEINFIARDDFQKSDTATLVVTAFKNELPVVNYKVKKEALSNDLRTIDLSSSYDMDEAFGGKIISYHYLINGDTYVISTSSITHSFPGDGSYSVSVFVTDNNYEVSQTKSFTIDI